MFPLADAGDLTTEIIRALSANGLWVFLSVCVISGIVRHVASEALKYRERVAMIENGIHPDTGEPRQTENLGQTVDYHRHSA